VTPSGPNTLDIPPKLFKNSLEWRRKLNPADRGQDGNGKAQKSMKDPGALRGRKGLLGGPGILFHHSVGSRLPAPVRIVGI